MRTNAIFFYQIYFHVCFNKFENRNFIIPQYLLIKTTDKIKKYYIITLLKTEIIFENSDDIVLFLFYLWV